MIDFSKIKKLTVDGVDLKSLAINGVQVWKAQTYTNQVPISIGSDGNIYNGGLGYKNGYRLSSSGGESSAANATVTGFIPVAPGDIIRIKGYIWLETTSTVNYLNAYNSKNGFSKVYIGNARNTYDTAAFIESMEYADGVSTVKLKNGVTGYDYIRISVMRYEGSTQKPTYGENLVVTVNEEIE